MKRMEIKPAEELYALSQSTGPKLVAEIMNGVREHVILRSQEEAEHGADRYTIYLKKGRSFVKDLLLDACVELAKEFEDKNYKVMIKDDGNGYYVDFIMIFSWSGKGFSLVKERAKILYTTDNGFFKYTTDNGIFKEE